MAYVDLKRRFVERQKYEPDELVAAEVRGRQVPWAKVLEGRASIVVAPANFGKTTEMQAMAARLRKAKEAAAFVELRVLAQGRSFDRAFEGAERAAYRRWKASSAGVLTLFVDSLDEAAANKSGSIEHLLSDIAEEVGWPSRRVRWVISTRPAVLNETLFSKISSLLETEIESIVGDSPSRKGRGLKGAKASSERDAGQKIKLFSMAPLEAAQAESYLDACFPKLPSKALLSAANERGLGGFARNPGGLDILANIDLVANPPDSLTEVFRRIVAAISILRVADHRLADVGNPDAEALNAAAQRLAAACQVCQLVNIEMPEATLEIPEKAISARLMVTPMLTEAATNQLLNSQLFIDVGHHQVKMYPDELLPFLAAQRLSAQVKSLDHAVRLLDHFTWSSPSGEQGVQREFLPMMGWLATFNAHCRAELLRRDPQALAFYGDLRSAAVPLADAEEALTKGLERLVEQGAQPGRGLFTLTSENFWQAGAPRLISVLTGLYDRFKGHGWARDLLLDVVTASRSTALRSRVLARHGYDYGRLLSSSIDVRYVVELGIQEDLAGLASAIKADVQARESLVGLLIGRLGWAHFTAPEIARMFGEQIKRGRDGFSVGYAIEHSDLLASASEHQLYQLSRAMVIQVARSRDRSGQYENWTRTMSGHFVEVTAKVVAALIQRENEAFRWRATRLSLVLQRTMDEAHLGSSDVSSLRDALHESKATRRALLSLLAQREESNKFFLMAAVVGSTAPCKFTEADIKAVKNPKLTKQYADHVAHMRELAKRHAKHRRPEPKPEVLKLTNEAVKALTKKANELEAGTAANEINWLARWLSQTSRRSRYSETDFGVFESQAGPRLTESVRRSLRNVWRSRDPKYDEAEPRSVYNVTIFGLQGLQLELGSGDNLPVLPEGEVRRALRYAPFEINGYPKWFWPLVKAYPDVAKEELLKIASNGAAGAVSREHAEELLTSLNQAPDSVRAALSPLAWNLLLQSGPGKEHVTDQLLRSSLLSPTSVPCARFEGLALEKMQSAFKSPLPAEVDADARAQRKEATQWAAYWLTAFPGNFTRAVEQWGPTDGLAVKEFLGSLAARLGRDQGAELAHLARSGKDGVHALEQLYEWSMWAVDPAGDNKREDYKAYTPNWRDHAQQFRDGLVDTLVVGHSQQAYDALARIRATATGHREIYLRRCQFTTRERQFARPALPQTSYEQFERDFRGDVTTSTGFAMAVHSDLLAVKYDLERGEHSLRSFFSEVDFTRINKPGETGKKAGLALEATFQRLLASELSHHAAAQYSITTEPQTAERKRRDVLCSRGDWHVSIELKMSERWSVEDYLVALEKQLLGQYMRNRRAMTGFLVVVLQKDRFWTDPTTGKRIRLNDVLRILTAKAQALEAEDRTLYLRVIGIDATPPADFRNASSRKSTTRRKNRGST